jgi:hypothetical protein
MSVSEAPAGNVVRLSARSRHLALSGSALLLLAGLGWYLSDAKGHSHEIIPAEDVPLAQRSVPARKVHAETDRGRPVGLYWVADANSYLTPVQEQEVQHVQIRLLRLIRSAPADERYNCYGWVFTDGTYWVYETDIPQILQDNGYREVEVPEAGDLILYRDAEGQIAHCGLVRVAGADGLILIESKWGEMGRFIHRPEDCTYGGRWTYYHTDRPGHCLTIRQP